VQTFQPEWLTKDFAFYLHNAYARAVLAVAMCLSVCVSHSRVLQNRLNGSSWFLAWRLPFTSPTLCCKEIWVFLRVSHSGTTLHLENFTTASVVDTTKVDA